MVKRLRAMTALEVIMAMFLMSIAITTVAYVFAGSVTRIGKSKILTQGAFYAQAIMDAALLCEPFEPVPPPGQPIGGPGSGFTYTVTHGADLGRDAAYFEIEVRVFHQALPPSQPAVYVVALKRYQGISQ